MSPLSLIVSNSEMNKQKERYYLEEFIKKSSLDIEVMQKEREKPDFEVRHDSSIKGIELVEVLKGVRPTGGSPQKKLESFRSDIMAIARREYFSKCQIPIEVKAFMATRLPKGGKGKNLVAQEIVGLLKSTTTSGQCFVPVRVSGNGKSISFLYITRVPNEINPTWLCLNNRVGWSRLLSDADIASLIASKEKKIPTYKESYDSMLLLLVVDSSSVSSMFHVSDLAHIKLASSDFERIYLYLYPDTVFTLF